MKPGVVGKLAVHHHLDRSERRRRYHRKRNRGLSYFGYPRCRYRTCTWSSKTFSICELEAAKPDPLFVPCLRIVVPELVTRHAFVNGGIWLVCMSCVIGAGKRIGAICERVQLKDTYIDQRKLSPQYLHRN